MTLHLWCYHLFYGQQLPSIELSLHAGHSAQCFHCITSLSSYNQHLCLQMRKLGFKGAKHPPKVTVLIKATVPQGMCPISPNDLEASLQVSAGKTQDPHLAWRQRTPVISIYALQCLAIW